MEKLKFSIKINALKQKVWSTLWNEATYRKWTAAFSEGSHAVSDWKEGSKILFLNATGNGMYSVIDKKIDNMQITFKHLGEIKNGVETEGDWSGALESYSLSEANGFTELQVEMDSNKEFENYFRDTFPKALQSIKQLSEA